MSITWTPTKEAGHVCFKVEVWGTLQQRAELDGGWPFVRSAHAATGDAKKDTPVILDSRQQNIGPIQCDIPKATPKPSPTSQGPSKRGWVYSKGGGIVRDAPSLKAKPVDTITRDYRLVYTDVVYDKNGKAEWYYVSKWGAYPPGWISADEVLTRRSNLPGPTKALDLKSVGLEVWCSGGDAGSGFRG